jgi:hypothetical protein
MRTKVSSASVTIALIAGLLAVASTAAARRAGDLTRSPDAIRVGSHTNWRTYHANMRRTGLVTALAPAGKLAIG